MSFIKNSSIYKKIKKAGKRYRRDRSKNPSFIRAYRKKIVRNIEKYLFRKKMSKAVPVFVFQMGKVGSLSIYESLLKQYPGAVAHAHTHIDDPVNWKSYMFYEWARNNGRMKIITPIRDPISRNISAFFHFVTGAGDTEDKSHLLIDELVELFLDNPERSGERQTFLDHEHPLKWFDVQMKGFFGIDVYESPFPETGLATYSMDNIDLLIMRIDMDDRKKEEAISKFLDLPGFVLENTNVGQEKDYSELYREFKKNVILPEDYIDKMCNSKYFRHFFTDKDINKVRGMWSDRRK